MSDNNAPGRQTFTDQLSSGEPSAQVAPLGKRPLIDLLTCMVCKVTIEICEQHTRRRRQRPASISLRIVQQSSPGAVVPLPPISQIELRQPSLCWALPILGGLPSRSSQPPAYALWASAWEPSLASRAKAGGGRRTRTFEVIRRLIYSQLPLPLGTLPRLTTSQTEPLGGGT